MTVDQISVFVENKAGRLAEITGILGQAGIDIWAMSIADTTDFGILRLIVNDPFKTISILRDADCIVSVTQVLAVSIPDSPGSLSRILKLLADAEISIEYLYASIARTSHNAYVVFRVEDNEKAEKLFFAHNVETASMEELFEL